DRLVLQPDVGEEEIPDVVVGVVADQEVAVADYEASGHELGGANISAATWPLNSLPWSLAAASLCSRSRVPLNEGAPRHGDPSVRPAEPLATAGTGHRLPAPAADSTGAAPFRCAR